MFERDACQRVLRASGSMSVDQIAHAVGARPADVVAWLADELAQGRVLYLPFGSGQWMALESLAPVASLFDGIDLSGR